jgi:hypothetical protein
MCKEPDYHVGTNNKNVHFTPEPFTVLKLNLNIQLSPLIITKASLSSHSDENRLFPFVLIYRVGLPPTSFFI